MLVKKLTDDETGGNRLGKQVKSCNVNRGSTPLPCCTYGTKRRGAELQEAEERSEQRRASGACLPLRPCRLP